LKGILRENPSS